MSATAAVMRCSVSAAVWALRSRSSSAIELPSDEITAYLTGFGRYGIPFNAVYGPGAPEGRLLPELLTDEAVLRALDLAVGS